MNPDNKLEFKDKEIEQTISTLTKANRRTFGSTFKSASAATAGKISSELGAQGVQIDSIGTSESGDLEAFSGGSVTGEIEREASPAQESSNSEIERPEISPEDAAVASAKVAGTGEEPAPVATVESSVQTTTSTLPTNTPKTTGSLPIDPDDEAKKEFYAIVRPLRTYERDIAEAVREKDVSIASVNIAAQKKRVEKGEPVSHPHPAAEAGVVAQKSLFLLISVVLIVVGLGFAGLIYYFFANQPAPVTPIASSIIATNETRNIDTAAAGSAQSIQEQIIAEMQKPGAAQNLVQVRLATGASETDPMLSPESFFTLFAPDAPAALGRALGPEWVFGFYNSTGNSAQNGSGIIAEPFILLNVNSFDNAFDGMLRWESSMAKNLGSLFIKPGTILTASGNISAGGFEDIVIRSKDVRALKDTFGNIVLLYSFLDPKNLVITTNEATFKKILTRFFSSQIIR